MLFPSRPKEKKKNHVVGQLDLLVIIRSAHWENETRCFLNCHFLIFHRVGHGACTFIQHAAATCLDFAQECCTSGHTDMLGFMGISGHWFLPPTGSRRVLIGIKQIWPPAARKAGPSAWWSLDTEVNCLVPPNTNMKWKGEVLVAQSCQTLCHPSGYSTPGCCPWDSQAGILEWWPFPSPGDLLNPGIKPGSPASQADSLLSGPPGKLEMKSGGQRIKRYVYWGSN